MVMRYNVETNYMKQNKHGCLSENTNPGSFFSRTIYMAIFNLSNRVNPGLNKGYLARGVDPAWLFFFFFFFSLTNIWLRKGYPSW